MESEQSDSCWYEYSFKSGQILFYYNKTTGEHKWPSSSNKNNNNSISCELVPHSRFQNNSTQTEDHDCVNGCVSMYIRNGPDMKNGSKVNSNQSKASCSKVNTDSDLVDSEWFGYACKSGQVLFYFNTKTGEHRWASNPHAYEYDKVGELLQSNVEVKSVSTQTHDFGCSNGCTSMYIQNNLKPHADFITTNDNSTCSGNIETETVVHEVDTTYNVYSSHFKDREDICSGSIETKRPSTYATQIHASRNQQRRTPNVIANKPDEQDLQRCSEVMVKQEQDDRLGCIFCYYHVDTKEKYYDHLKTHCDCGCPLCGKVSGEESDLLIHLKQHLEGNQSDTNEVKQGIRNSPDRDSRPYNCGRCNKGFSKLSYLKSHERVHLGVKPYRCKCCHKKFSHRNAVKLHQRTHSDLKPYKCAYCDKVFSLRHSLIHHKHVHTKPYKCSFCDKVFLGRNALINHNKRIHNGEKLYECTKCNKRFAKIYGLLSHKRIHTEDKPYKCTYCDKTFRFSTGLKAHERYHTGFKPYSCKYCQKSFSQKDQLRKHENMHAGVKPHTCSLCNKSFAIKQCLKAHLLTHTGEKPYKCEICGKSFRINAYLTDHKRVHTGERPFKCTFCDKTFKLHGDRRKHERTHTGVKPYQCTHCSKAFVRSSELKVHERVHNGDKPFKCADCDKTFVSSSQLYSHKRRIHSEVRSYQCTQCDKAFKLPECLKKHVSRVHIRIKRFKCDCCGMKFIANNELTSHKLTHTDKKPYQCTQCSKTFKRVRQLRVHERVHNN